MSEENLLKTQKNFETPKNKEDMSFTNPSENCNIEEEFVASTSKETVNSAVYNCGENLREPQRIEVDIKSLYGVGFPLLFFYGSILYVLSQCILFFIRISSIDRPVSNLSFIFSRLIILKGLLCWKGNL